VARGAGGFGGGRLAAVGRLNLANIHVTVGWSVLLHGLAAAVVIALAGSAIPSLLLARVRPAEVLRADWCSVPPTSPRSTGPATPG